MKIIHFFIYYVLVLLALNICRYYQAPSSMLITALVLFIFLPLISKLLKRGAKPSFYSQFGVLVFSIILCIHLCLCAGQKNYISVATTDDIEQVYKIQTVLLDYYMPVRVTRDGNIYSVEVAYDTNILEYTSVTLAESGVISENTNLKIGIDYSDISKIGNQLVEKLNKIIPHIEGVYKADVRLKYTVFSFSNELPIAANIWVETDNNFITERIEKTIKNLLLASVYGLKEDDINIEFQINESDNIYGFTEYYRTARKLYREQKYQEALTMLEKENKIFPDRNKQSIINLKELIKLNKQITQTPKNYTLYIKRGDIKNVAPYAIFTAMPQGITSDYTGAIADYSKALELNPKAYEIYERRGNAYHNADTPKTPSDKDWHESDFTNKAIEDYKKAIKHTGGNDYLFENIGNYYFYEEDYKTAIEYYENISEQILFPERLPEPIPVFPNPDLKKKDKIANYLPLRIVKCYKELQQYDKAKELCNKILTNTTDKDYINYTKQLIRTLI